MSLAGAGTEWQIVWAFDFAMVQWASFFYIIPNSFPLQFPFSEIRCILSLMFKRKHDIVSKKFMAMGKHRAEAQVVVVI